MKTFKQRILTLFLAAALLLIGIVISENTATAAGWPDATKELTLGTTVTGTIKEGDYEGNVTDSSGSYYWHVYKFSMPQNGLLNVYLESDSKTYLAYYFYYDGFAIYSAENPDYLIWASDDNRNEISPSYSSARDMYSGSTEISLDKGEYYFVLRQNSTINSPYYLTLSYREPTIHISSISLDKRSLSMEIGSKQYINASVLPDNATDKTIWWESSDSGVARVENGLVTAISIGNATVRAVSGDGEIVSECTVQVTETAENRAIQQIKYASTRIYNLIPKKRKVKIQYDAINVSGCRYEVSYKTSGGIWKSFQTTKCSGTIKNLLSKKAYSFRVRGYKPIGGKIYYSKWSSTVKAKIK